MHIGTLTLPDGRDLQYYDATPDARDAVPVIYHHGSPNIGEPPVPLFDAAAERGLRWLGYDRPGYGGSTRAPGRTIADAAADTVAVADAAGVARFAVLGHSGGGAHALACAALAPERVVGAVSISGLAPWGSPGLDYFAGINAGGEAELSAATQGAEALAAHLAAAEFDASMFIDSDWDALKTDWAWFNSVVERAEPSGSGPFIDDDVASVSPWGFAPADIRIPTLIMHGTADRVVPVTHAWWLAANIEGANLLEVRGAGHISVMRRATEALDWLASVAANA